MANNQWVADPNDPSRMTYTDEQGNVHVAVRDTGAQVQRNNNGNVVDVTFPNYKPPAGQPAPQQPAPPAERRGWGDRFADSWKEAGQHGSIGVISRNGLYYSGYGKEEVAKMFPNLSPEEQDKKRWELINATQRRMRDEADARRKADPTWKPDRTFVEQVASGDWIPDLAGQIFGGFGPENAIAPGSNAVQRIGAQGVIGGVTSAASQGADIHDNVADEFDTSQVGMDALASMGGQAILEGLGKVAARGKARLFGEEPKVDTPDAPSAPVAPEKYVIPVEDRAGIEDMLRSGASLDDIRAKYPRAVFGKNGTTLQWYINNRGKWKKVNWTGEDAPGATGSGVNEPVSPDATGDEIVVTGDKSSLDLKPEQAIGPNGESVSVSPQRDQDWNGHGFREYRAVDAEGNVLHEGRVYDDGQVIGQRPDGSYVEDVPTADFVRFRGKTSESLDNLAPGQPVDPAAPTGELAGRPIDPDLAKQFDEAIPAPSRRDQIKAASAELSTQTDPGLKSVKPFPETEPDYHRFRFVTEDGKVVDGTYTYSDGHIDNLSIGDTNKPIDLGPKEISKLFGELRKQHPEASKVSAYRMTGSRAKEGKGPEFMEVNFKDTPAAQKSPEPAEEAPVLDHAESDPPVTEETISRLTESLNKAGKATDEQKALNTQTRKERFQAVGKARHATSGEAGLAAEMAQLKGEFPKVVREPVRQDFSQEEIDGLFDAVKTNPMLSWGESIRARIGLYKLLDGHPISANEISLLGRVFPKDFVKAALKHRSTKGKIGDIIGNTLNLPRSLMSSFDLSAPFRQAWFFSTKKEFWKALPGMFRQAFSEKTFEDVMKEIRLRPNYERMESSGLSFSDLSSDIHAREEAFISNYAKKIPIVRGSERGFTGFLNKVRADVFDDLAAKAKAAGHDIDDPQFLKDLSGFINNATGRGSLGKFSQAGPFLNGLFFSPRLISSRLSLLNPVYYATLDPFVRKEAIKQLMATSALSVSVLTLAAAGGLNVEADPRSTDFGKIRDGDTRYDVLGGFGQYITLFARLATNQQKNSKGKVDELGKGFGAPTRLDILGRFATGKASPIAGYTASYLRGKDPTGQPFEPGKQARDLFIPLFLQDVRDVMADEGPEGLKKAIPSFFGVGVSAYNNAPAFDRLGQQNDKQGGRMPGGFFTGDPANKPVVDELARIEAATGKELYKPVAKNDVKDFQMTDEQFYNYQYYAGAYIREDLKQVFASPEYQQASEEDKVKMVKEVVKDQKANARDLLFPKQ